MRITNKIMQNNSLTHINNAKVAEDTLSTQLSSGKKIVRPSDDPIVAIRSLRLRSSVTEIKQYYSSNVPDAKAWLNTTEDAMQQVSTVLTDMIKQYTKGSNADLTTSDRKIVLEQLKALKNEVYATGDADYAGRYVFTGYRTETSLMFQEDTKLQYEITEQIDASALTKGSYVNTSVGDKNLAELQEGTQQDYAAFTEQDMSTNEYYRIRLSYKDCDEVVPGDDTFKPSISYIDGTHDETDAEGNVTTVADWKTLPDDAHPLITMKSTDINPSPYTEIAKAGNEDCVIYLADTGELLLGQNVYTTLSQAKDDGGTQKLDESEIRVTYQKTNFQDGDLRPQHYFYCKTTDAENGEIEYNSKYLEGKADRQVIEYDVGYDQRLQVNTTADECFDPAITREIDDAINLLEKVDNLEGVLSTLKEMKEKCGDEDAKTVLQNQIDAANKALTYAKQNMQKYFEGSITTMQGFLDQANIAVTNCGARGSRLELIESRLCSQKTTFETLKSENEDADLSEVAVQLASAELTYEAALKASAKIMTTNLMDFI